MSRIFSSFKERERDIPTQFDVDEYQPQYGARLHIVLTVMMDWTRVTEVCISVL